MIYLLLINEQQQLLTPFKTNSIYCLTGNRFKSVLISKILTDFSYNVYSFYCLHK